MNRLTTISFINAVAYAADAHNGQVRKGSDTPYLAHPLAVASLVMEFGGDEELAIAGLLHDVIEDGAPVYEQEMQENFGARVYSIVRALTDGTPDPETGEKPAWQPRKEAHIAKLRNANPDVLLVAACDKIHNARSLIADVRRDGLSAYAKFRGGIKGTLWYLREMAAVTACTAAGATLAELVGELSSTTELAGAIDSSGGQID